VIVVDASVAVLAFVGTGVRGHRAREILAGDPEWLVPEHWSVEVFSALRGLAAGRALADRDAVRTLDRLRSAQVHEVNVRDLLARMWALRHNLSAYAAPYVVLAAERDLTLVTGDARMARSALAHCRVELV
jgi:predicted nucleic acid-binding protein